VSSPLSLQTYDVIVVGMGPAGACAAYELSQRGFSVLAFDKQAHPRYKVCGGGLSARIAKILPADFQSIVEETVHRVQFAYGAQESFLIESPEPIAYMVMRQHFDQWLVDKARHAGTVIHEEETVIEIQNRDEGVDVLTKQGRYHSRIVIGADGVMSVVAQQYFPGPSLRNIPALESEVHGESLHAFQKTPTALISLQAAKKGYGWIFPKKQGLSLGVGEFVKGTKRPKQSFRDFIGNEPMLAGLGIPAPLGYPIPIASVHAYRNGQTWAGRLVRGRAMLVGDAGHLVDPLLGEGIYYAVRSGQLAARSVSDMLGHSGTSQLNQYEALVAREFGQELRVAGRLGKIIYEIPRSWHRWAGQQFPDAYQRVLKRYCEVLQGKETYQTLWDHILRRLHWPFTQWNLG
jgi:geranylgeranyl reductase family protein